MKKILLIILFFPALANAEQIEPKIGPISDIGSVLDVETYHCEVSSPRSIRCWNVGRVCVEQRKRDEERRSRRFGCALKENKNYPCPPDDPNEKKEHDTNGYCWPTIMGGF